MSLEDETRSGCPSDATDEEMCNKVRDLVYSDRRIKVEEIANALHISHGNVSTCNKVRDLVYSNRRIKVEEIANALHISHGSVSTTLHDCLGMH